LVELDRGELALSLLSRRHLTFPNAPAGPDPKGGCPMRIRAETADMDPGDVRLLLLFVAGYVSFTGGVATLSAQDPGGRLGGMLIIGGVICAKNAAAPLIFSDGVDATFISEPIAGCGVSLPTDSPDVTAGAAWGVGGCRPQRLQHYSQFEGASRQLGSLHLLLLEA
jgi:hypothetical protein